MGAKDGNGNTAREAYYNRIGDKANHTPQPQYAHKDEDKPGYEGGNGQPFDAVLLDNTVDNNDKSTCRSPDLYGTPTQKRDNKAPDDSGCEANLGAYAAGNTKGYGKG